MINGTNKLDLNLDPNLDLKLDPNLDLKLDLNLDPNLDLVTTNVVTQDAVSASDVVIIGAGVVGAALARELSRYVLDVLLVEKEADVCFGTSKANSGIVHSGIHESSETLKGRLCVAGNRMFDELAEELDVLYKNNGSLIVSNDPGQWLALEELKRNGLTHGIPGITLLNGDDIRKLEPNLAPDLAGGLWVPSGGIVAPYELVFALVENAVANGVRLQLNTEVTGIWKAENHWLVKTGRGVIQARFVVNAAGIRSGEIARMAGDESFAIFPRKGEEYVLDRRLEGLVLRTIFPLPGKESKGILVIPTVGGNIMIGPTAQNVESDAGLTTSGVATSGAGWNEVYQSVSKLVPSLALHLPGDVITSFAGLRAISDREDFIIGPAPGMPQFFHAAGIKSPGLTAAPAIAQYLVEAMGEQGLPLQSRRDFNPLRRAPHLRHLDREAQTRLIHENPAYGNIICRCELVSEAEIRAAIHRGATTLDSVKLRTRSGMGRCQGGFCASKIIQILAEELDLAPTEITKKGPGSPLLMGRLRDCK